MFRGSPPSGRDDKYLEQKSLLRAIARAFFCSLSSRPLNFTMDLLRRPDRLDTRIPHSTRIAEGVKLCV